MPPWACGWRHDERSGLCAWESEGGRAARHFRGFDSSCTLWSDPSLSPRFIVFHRRVLVGWSCALLILAALWWLLSTDLVRPAIAPTEAVSGKLVVIDPGHGGPDPGAVGVGGTLEKEIVLAIAELLEPMLRRAAVYTLRLREGDYDLVERHGAGGFGSRKRDDLMLRAQAANDAGADLFLSLHANSFPSPRWSGAQTFYDPSDPASRRLAEALQHRLREAVPQNTRLARPGDYLVLKETQMPAVVVELGFLSNPDEERLLNSEAYRQNLARAIFHGIVDYLIGEAQPGEAPEAGVAPTSAEGFPPVEESELPPGGFHLYFHSSENERATGSRRWARRFPRPF